jgi:hypothetical protein
MIDGSQSAHSSFLIRPIANPFRYEDIGSGSRGQSFVESAKSIMLVPGATSAVRVLDVLNLAGTGFLKCGPGGWSRPAEPSSLTACFPITAPEGRV